MNQQESRSGDAWLERALEVLRQEGIQGVRVERLAREPEVSKGSFTGTSPIARICGAAYCNPGATSTRQ